MDNHTYGAILDWIVSESQNTDWVPWRDNAGRIGLEIGPITAPRAQITFAPPVVAGTVCRLHWRGTVRDCAGPLEALALAAVMMMEVTS